MFDGLPEKRRSLRHDAAQSTIYLGWWDEPDFRTFEAELINLSHGGALILSAVPPPEDQPLWVCQTSGPVGDWAGVELVSVAPPTHGVFPVRLRFAESCPYELFAQAIHGISVGV